MFRPAIFLLALLAAEPAVGADLVPFTATYSVTYRGFDAGRLHFELRREEDLFIYESRPEPSMLARFLVGSEAHERSVIRIDARGVRPQSWYVDDGKRGKRQDGSLTFLWDAGKVRGTVKGKPVELPAEPGLQDRLSVQIAVMLSLLRGIEPGIIPMISDDEIKHYSYRRLDSPHVRTPAGEFDTVLYESTRPGSERLSRFWHAPALGYIPARAEQMRKGKLETVMELVVVNRTKAE